MSETEPPAPPAPPVPPPVVPPAPPLGPLGLDCSPEAQALRWQRLRELEGSFYNGAAQISDRGRQVTFVARADLGAAMAGLRAEINACMVGAWPRRRPRVFFVPQVKGL